MDGPESKYLTLIGFFFFFVGFSGWLVVFFFFLIFFYLRRTGEAGADSAAPELGRDAAAGPRTGPGNRSRPQPAGAGRFFFIHRHPSTPFFCFFSRNPPTTLSSSVSSSSTRVFSWLPLPKLSLNCIFF